jgi:hypothetical protein
MPQTLRQLRRQAGAVFDDLNNNHQGLLRKSVYTMKKRAIKCMRVGGRLFEGKRVSTSKVSQ